MAQKKPAAKKSGTKNSSANAKPKRARNKDGTYKGDDKSTPDVNEAYEQPKEGTKATTKPRNPAAKQREATAKKPAAKKPAAKKPAAKKPVATASSAKTTKASPAKKQHTYAPKIQENKQPAAQKPVDPPEKRQFPVLPDDTATKKGRLANFWSWLVGS